MVDFTVGLLGELEKFPLQKDSFHWHNRIYLLCLAVFKKVLSRSSIVAEGGGQEASMEASSSSTRPANVASIVCARLVSHFGRTPQLLISVLQAASILGVSAIQCSPSVVATKAAPKFSLGARSNSATGQAAEPLQQQQPQQQKVPVRNMFPAGSVLPVEMSYGLSEFLSATEVQGMVAVMYAGLDVLNLLIQVQAQIAADLLPTTLSFITSGAEVLSSVYYRTLSATSLREAREGAAAGQSRTPLVASTVLPCSYLTVFCGITTTASRAIASVKDTITAAHSSTVMAGFAPPRRLRLKALSLLTNIIQCMSLLGKSATATNMKKFPTLGELLDLPNLPGFCYALCDAIQVPAFASAGSGSATATASAAVSSSAATSAAAPHEDSKSLSIAALDLLLLIGEQQPATLALLFAVRAVDSSGTSSAASAATTGLQPVGCMRMNTLSALSESAAKDSILATALNNALVAAESLYKHAPLMLHKVIVEVVTITIFFIYFHLIHFPFLFPSP
jgi:hypothetical protein